MPIGRQPGQVISQWGVQCGCGKQLMFPEAGSVNDAIGLALKAGWSNAVRMGMTCPKCSSEKDKEMV